MANPISKYLREATEELKKVSWPTQSQLINQTIVVILITIFIAAFFALLDYLFGGLVRFLIG